MPDRQISLTREKPSEQEIDGEWFRVDGLEVDVRAHVLVEWDDDQRAVVKEVRVTSGRVLAEAMYEIPLGQVVRVLNSGSMTVTADGIEMKPPGKLRRIQGMDAVAFAHQVAQHYRYHAAMTSKPAVAIAEANGVPVGTVRGWIRDARKLGQLPKGRRGAVG